MPQGKIHGVGLGPGSSDLMSVRAERLVRESKYVAYFRKKGGVGRARSIVEGMLRDDVIELPMEYPLTTEISFNDPQYNQLLNTFYQQCTDYLLALSHANYDVAVICEGDPFFYGSFMHLYSRLTDSGADVALVPAITGMSAAWSASGSPITWGDDVLTVLTGTLPEEKLLEHISNTDALVIMKIGQHLDKIKRVLAAANKLDAAFFVQYAAMENQAVMPLKEVTEKAPYFSIVLVHGHGRRP